MENVNTGSCTNELVAGAGRLPSAQFQFLKLEGKLEKCLTIYMVQLALQQTSRPPTIIGSEDQ